MSLLHKAGICIVSIQAEHYGATQTEHDIALEALFERLDENGLTLNKSKCEFNRDKVAFFGIVFSADGIPPDEKKAHAIHETKPVRKYI